MRLSLLAAIGTVVVAMLVVGCGDGGTGGAVTVTSPEPSQTAAPTDTPAPMLTPTLTEEASIREPGTAPNCLDRQKMATEMGEAVEVALLDYPGDWGFAFIDVLCNTETSVNPEYAQYAASAGKIVSIIAVLRAVDAGLVELEAVEEQIRVILRLSLDETTDEIETFIGQEDLDEVLELSGVVDSRIDATWRETNFTATDLARVWAALVDRRLLSAEMTTFLLELAAEPEIPDGYETFPDVRFEHPAFELGQKAGYFVVDGIPYFLVGAGYLRHRSSGDYFVPVVMIETELEELLDPQRREVFPVVLEYVERMVGYEPASATE